jgi:hypothetical protein
MGVQWLEIYKGGLLIKHEFIYLDLETLGHSPDGVITQIGAVYHALEVKDGVPTPIQNTYHAYLDWEQGRVMHADVVAYWFRHAHDNHAFMAGVASQGDRARGVQPWALSIGQALHEFLEWWGSVASSRDIELWAQGTDFDVAIMRHAFKQHNLKEPWKFYLTRDSRTLIQDWKSRGNDIPPRLPSETPHSAIGDALYGARVVSYIKSHA